MDPLLLASVFGQTALKLSVEATREDEDARSGEPDFDCLVREFERHPLNVGCTLTASESSLLYKSMFAPEMPVRDMRRIVSMLSFAVAFRDLGALRGLRGGSECGFNVGGAVRGKLAEHLEGLMQKTEQGALQEVETGETGETGEASEARDAGEAGESAGANNCPERVDTLCEIPQEHKVCISSAPAEVVEATPQRALEPKTVSAEAGAKIEEASYTEAGSAEAQPESEAASEESEATNADLHDLELGSASDDPESAPPRLHSETTPIPQEDAATEERPSKRRRRASPEPRTKSALQAGTATPSTPETPSTPGASGRNERTDKAERASHKRFQTTALAAVADLKLSRYASVFQQPVTEENYLALIRTPTDLKTIKSQIREGIISTPSELDREVQRMFANAVMYNPEGSQIYEWARSMQQEAELRLQVFREGFEMSRK